MTEWRFTIRGFSDYLTEDTSPDAVRAAAAGCVKCLKRHAEQFAKRMDEGSIDELEDVIGTLETDGETGKADLFNEALSLFCDWCDANSVWVAPIQKEAADAD